MADFEATFTQYIEMGDSAVLGPWLPQTANLAFAAVYRNGYFKTCIDALTANFPIVVYFIGEATFRLLARAYVDAHPPRRGTLAGYGELFASFLIETHDLHNLRGLEDIANLDYAWLNCHFAAEPVTLSAERVGELTEAGHDIEDLSVRTGPHVQLVTAAYAVFDAWTAARINPGKQLKIRLATQVQHILLWRDYDGIKSRLLDTPEHRFIAAMSKGVPLGRAATAVIETNPEFEVASTFAALLQNNILEENHG